MVSAQATGCLTPEQTMNYVLFLFWERSMFKLIAQEAAALASLALFIGMIAIWMQVLGNL
jgi:hypothetical protein